MTTEHPSYRVALRRLSDAQKPAARSAPAYSRFVNRRIGRYLAAWAFTINLSANTVTAISAAWTFLGIALIALVPPSFAQGAAVAVCLLVGYAFDSADGQVSRLTGTSSPAGEWLDHVVDSVKVSLMPIAVTIGFFRFTSIDVGWLLVPLAYTVVSAVLFFTMILTEQLRRQRGIRSLAGADGRSSWLNSVLVLPMDYGVLCLSFVLLGVPILFFVVYSLLFIATTAFLVLATKKWFRELKRLGPPTATKGASA